MQTLRSMAQFMTMVRPLHLLRSWHDCTGYLPLEVTLWLTYRCNAHCSFCIFTDEENRRQALSAGELSLEQIYRLLNDPAALGDKRIMITGGEPTLRRDLVDIVAYATHHRIRTGIFNNGSLLSRSLAEELVAARIDTICISLDAADTVLHDSLLGCQVGQSGLQMTTRRIIEKLESLDVIETFRWDGSRLHRTAPVDEEQAALLETLAHILAELRLPRWPHPLPSAGESLPLALPPPRDCQVAA